MLSATEVDHSLEYNKDRKQSTYIGVTPTKSSSIRNDETRIQESIIESEGSKLREGKNWYLVGKLYAPYIPVDSPTFPEGLQRNPRWKGLRV